jgi:magnesium transporter
MAVDPLALAFLREHPGDAARVLEPLPAPDVAAFLAGTAPAVAAPVINLLASQAAARCLENLPSAHTAAILEKLHADVAVMLLRRLAPDLRRLILGAMPARRAAALHMALRYPDAVVGSVMDAAVFAVREDLPVREVISAARIHGGTLQDHLFVVNDRKELVGVVDVMQVLVSDRSLRIEELATPPLHSFAARASLAGVRDDPAWDSYNLVPVVDHNRLLLGVVSRDTVNRALAARGAPAAGDAGELLDLLLAFAETVWTVCTDYLLQPDSGRRHVETRR